MKFGQLLELVGDQPVFETGVLLAGDVDPVYLRRQLLGWVRAGRVYQLRRGLYALAPPFRKVVPHPFLVANRLVRGSYVSLQSALAHRGLIPEAVPVTTSVTLGRPQTIGTPLGTFDYRHVQPKLFGGYELETLGDGTQQAFVASGEKALADLVHLVPDANRRDYLAELRLSLERLDLARVASWPSGRARKLGRARAHLAALLREEEA